MSGLQRISGRFAETTRGREPVVRAVGVLVATAVGIFALGLILGFAVVGRHGGGAIQGWDDTVGRWYL